MTELTTPEAETAASDTVRSEILRLFEVHRETPGAPFDESHFLDFLLDKPEGKRAVHNSRAGVRRYHAFIEDVQLHFGICFSRRDDEATYSLTKFVARVAALQDAPRSCLASFHRQRAYGWGTVVILNLPAAAVIVAVRRLSVLLAIPLLALVLLVDVVVVRDYIRWRAYRKKLAIRLNAPERTQERQRK